MQSEGKLFGISDVKLLGYYLAVDKIALQVCPATAWIAPVINAAIDAIWTYGTTGDAGKALVSGVTSFVTSYVMTQVATWAKDTVGLSETARAGAR